MSEGCMKEKMKLHYVYLQKNIIMKNWIKMRWVGHVAIRYKFLYGVPEVKTPLGRHSLVGGEYLLVWIGFIWLKIRTGGRCEYCNEPACSIQCRERVLYLFLKWDYNSVVSWQTSAHTDERNSGWNSFNLFVNVCVKCEVQFDVCCEWVGKDAFPLR